MSGRGQQTGLLVAALGAHLLLLAAIPPVAASTSERSCPLRINVALADPQPVKQAVQAAELESPAPGQRQPAPLAARRALAPASPAPAARATPKPADAPAEEAESAPEPASAVPAASRVVGLRPASSVEPGGLRLPQGQGSAANSVPGQSTAGSPDSPGTAGAVSPTQPPVDTDKLLRDYSSGVIARIRSQQRYPASAERAGIEGKVKLSFTLSADGSLLASSVSESSGSAELDGAALAAVQAAAPFAAIPAALQRSSAKLSVTLNFSLK